MNKKTGFTYILTNKTRSVLYVGVTSDLLRRVYQHRNKQGGYFTKKYNIHLLLYFEEYSNIGEAIAREKKLKNWNHKWKMELIKKTNPDLRDLWPELIRYARSSRWGK